jgi:exonuclease-1
MKNAETRNLGRQTLIKTVEVSTLVPRLKKLINDELGGRIVDAEFEADQALARLALQGSADLILTEDSDLIVYGCEKVMFKFRSGRGQLFSRSVDDPFLKSFDSWLLFQRFCVLCGCDYFNFSGLGPRKTQRICSNEKAWGLWIGKQTEDNIIAINNSLKIFLNP